jgi:autotransporter-associated beta strand protein
MISFKNFISRISIVFLFILSFNFTYSQTSVYWRTDGPSDGKWLWGSTCDPAGDGQWFYNVWGGFRQAPDCYGSHNVFFDGNGINTMNLNSRDFGFQTLTFTSNATAARTLNADGTFRLLLNNLSGTPKIENLSATGHIINAPLTFNALSELNPVNGDLSFQEINNNGNELNVWGDNAKNINFNGIISGTGKFVLKQYSNAKFGAVNTYSGNTEIDKGELWIETTGNAIANDNIFVGNGGQLGNVTKLFLSRTSGGTTFTRNININSGNSGTRFIGSLNTSGTNTFSGSILRSASGRPLTIEVPNSGGTLAITGVINGSNDITKIGAGTLQLGTNNSTMAGTWLIENGTVLTDNFPARMNVKPITLGSATTSGTLRFTTTSGGTTSIQFNVNAGGGAIYNASTTNFASNTSFSPNGPLTVGAESTGNLTFAGAIGGTQSVTYNSTGTGKVVLGVAMTYTGATRITSGTMETNNSNRIANTSNIIMNGGTYSTGATTGYTDVVGTLQLLENSTIRLGDGGNAHTLTFAASNGVSWTSGRTLTITNWSGTPGVAGTAAAGRVFVGSANTHLTAAQLDQITFQGYAPGAVMKSSGELMPRDYLTYYSKGSLAPEVLTNWSLTRDGSGASPANFSSTANFVVQNAHTMTTAVAWTLSGASSTLQIENGGVLVSTFAITIPATGIFQVDNGGLYKHNNTSSWATTIFTGTEVFGNSSTVEINKTAITLPTNSTYGNLTYDLNTTTGQAVNFSGNLTTINGNFIVKNTQGFELRLANTGTTLTISGNLEVHPNAIFTLKAGTATGDQTVRVDGNVSLLGGTFYLNGPNSTSGGVAFLVARGASFTISENVTLTGGNLVGASGFYFNRNVEQTLNVAHPFSTAGIRNRFFVSTVNSNVINEVYNGVAAQTTIDGTGVTPGANWSPWPTATAGTALKSFTINNSAGVTLSTNRFVNTTLGLTNGTITPGANSLTLAATATFSGGSSTSYVNGILNRVYAAIGNSIFPVGKAGVYRPLGFEYTALTGTSTVSVEQIESALTGTLPSNTNLNNSRQWNVSQTGGSGIQYKVTLDPTGDDISGTVVLLKKESGTITSNASTSPNYTNSSTFSTLTGTNNFTLGSTCTVSSNAGSNSTICDGTSMALVANTPTFGTGAWTVSGPSNSLAQFSNVALSNANFTPSGGAGDYTLTWAISNGNCSSSSNFVLTVNSLSTNPTSATASATTICDGSSTTLTLNGGSAGTGGVITWYSGSCGGTLVGTGNGIIVSPTSNTTYFGRYEGTCNNTTCQSVAITVNTLSTDPTSATAGSPTICEGASTTLTLNGGSAGTGGVITWYSGSCGGTLVGTGNGLSVSPTATTTYFGRYEGTCNNTTCQSVTITVNTLSTNPTSATASATTICNGSSTTLTLNGGSAGTGGVITWYSGSCGGTLVGTGNGIIVSPTSNTTYFGRYEGTCNNTTCQSVSITVDQLPTASAGTTINSFVGNFETISGASASNGTIQWTENGAGNYDEIWFPVGNPTTVSPTYSVVEGDWGNTVTLTMTVTGLGTCSASTATANVTINVDNRPGLWHYQCGTTTPYIDEYIYNYAVPGATNYRIRISDGVASEIRTSASTVWFFRQFAMAEYNTTYTCDVDAFVGGSWVGYGPACQVTTPVIPLTKVANSQCGTSLATVNTTIFADAVWGVDLYEFSCFDGATTQTFQTTNRFFNLTQLLSYSFSTTYQIRVRTRTNGVWTALGATCNVTTPAQVCQIIASQCGSTLANNSTDVFCNLIPNTTIYEFRLVNGGTTLFIQKPSRTFKFSQVLGCLPGVTYAVSVRTFTNGLWSSFGPSCNITSASSPSKIIASQCGNTLSNIETDLFADAVVGATQYRFRVSNSGGTLTILKSSRTFKLTQLANVKYGEVNTIDVDVFVNGSWIGYGATCAVTSPALPSSKIQASQCGITLGTTTTILYADQVFGATQYRFRVINAGLSYNQIITKASRLFRMSELSGLTINTPYEVDVAVFINGSWQNYGSICSITTPGVLALPTMENDIFADLINVQENEKIEIFEEAAISNADIVEIEAFPNPFSDQFELSLSDNYSAKGQIIVYDGMGKIIEKITLNELIDNRILLGSNYSKGIYLISIIDDREINCIKVIKN